jgi:hypothetical protein
MVSARRRGNHRLSKGRGDRRLSHLHAGPTHPRLISPPNVNPPRCPVNLPPPMPVYMGRVCRTSQLSIGAVGGLGGVGTGFTFVTAVISFAVAFGESVARTYR